MQVRASAPSGQHWALLPFVTGIIVGLSVSTVILVRPYTEHIVTNVYIGAVGPGVDSHSKEVQERLLRFEELMKELHPASHVDTGPRFLAEEVIMKAPVHYAIIVSSEYSSEMIDMLKNTWTGDTSEDKVSYYISTKQDMGKQHHADAAELEMEPNVVKLSEHEHDEIQVLNHMCQHKLNTTKWFFFGYDTAYVKTLELESYLLTLEASQEYLPYLGKPVKRDPVGTVCLPGTGSILSYLALSELCPMLSRCTETKDHRGMDSILGECVIKQLPRVQCNKEGHPHNLFLKFDGNKKGPVIDPKNKVILDRALTIYPVADPKLMYNVHQLVVSKRLNESQHLAQELKQTVDKMVALLPQAEGEHARFNGETVKSREDIVSWQLINHDRLMIKDSDNPVMKVPGVWKCELDRLTTRAMEYLNSLHEDQELVVSRVMNAYWRLHPLIGMEYIIDFEAKSSHSNEEDNPTSTQFCAFLSRSYNPPEVSPIQPQVRDSKRVTIALVMTAEQMDPFQVFMKGLEQVLSQDQRLDLIVVKMRTEKDHQVFKKPASDSTLDSILHSYETRFLRASFRVINSPYILSRAHGLALVLHEVKPTDILFLADLYLNFTASFLDRCRSFPLQGQQAYYPLPFAAESQNTTNQGHERTVTSQIGHWLVKSHGLSCVYAADVLSSVQQKGGKGVPKEVESGELYRSLLEKEYEVIRSVDSDVWRRQPENIACELDLVGEEQDPCEVVHESPYARLKLRTQLSQMLFDHEGKQSEKKF